MTESQLGVPVGVVSRGILGIAHLPAFLGQRVAYIRPFLGMRRELDGIAVWGRRPTAEKAILFARSRGVERILRLEDGFLRSVHPGKGSQTCSLVIDEVGIYYDASSPSHLETLISEPLREIDDARARRLIEHWQVAGVSKYNHAPDPIALPAQPYVLVIDQTANDASVQYGGADASSFERMLRMALSLYPNCQVIVKEHPEVALGRKRGYLGKVLDRCPLPRVIRMTEDAHVVPLLRAAQAVFTVTSQVGFEALLHGKRVHTFGMPFYAGWGLTEDDLPAPERRRPVPLAQLAFAALVRYTRYVLPHTGERCEVEDVIEHLALQRRMRHQFPQRLHAVGFSRWKRPVLRQFLQGHDVRFHRQLPSVPRGATVVRWGRGVDMAERPDVDVITVEDGFLRSVGLGARLVRPVSWVFDRSGIYYDATGPSDLERLLNEANFDSETLERAARLRESIVRAGVTKYNVGTGGWSRPPSTKPVLLAVGQVESDAALQFGTSGTCTNRQLLEAVRAEAPHAYIIYKPHPDVMAGLRGSKAEEAVLSSLCDEVVEEVSMHELLRAVDGVHVLTSLAGFEALLRGKPVTTHGVPFYAGWGLTRDRCHVARRQRSLTLDMLVAGALIQYPRYVSRNPSAGFAPPEQVVADLQAWRADAPQPGVLSRLMQPLLRYWATKRTSVSKRDPETAC